MINNIRMMADNAGCRKCRIERHESSSDVRVSYRKARPPLVDLATIRDSRGIDFRRISVGLALIARVPFYTSDKSLHRETRDALNASDTHYAITDIQPYAYQIGYECSRTLAHKCTHARRITIFTLSSSLVVSLNPSWDRQRSGSIFTGECYYCDCLHLLSLPRFAKRMFRSSMISNIFM